VARMEIGLDLRPSLQVQLHSSVSSPQVFSSILAGLDPAIHVFLRLGEDEIEGVDARNKSGQDDREDPEKMPNIA
jgi:hypothetical protein